MPQQDVSHVPGYSGARSAERKPLNLAHSRRGAALAAFGIGTTKTDPPTSCKHRRCGQLIRALSVDTADMVPRSTRFAPRTESDQRSVCPSAVANIGDGEWNVPLDACAFAGGADVRNDRCLERRYLRPCAEFAPATDSMPR